MNPEALTLEVRPRSPWEAMDLSVRLCMQHWRILLSGWLITVLPIFVIISLLLLETHPYWAFILVWYLKPIYDRVPLFILSRVIFSEPLNWRDVLKAVPGFFKTGLLSSLTLYRLDMGRAFALPTVQLEGLCGKQRTRRMSALRRGAKNREGLLFILCINLESLLYWGIIGMILLLLPTDLAIKGAELVLVNDEQPLWVNALSMLMYFLAMMVMEILYVAGGFMLCLNRRTILEGWDIELTFRRLQRKHQQKHSRQKNRLSAARAVAAVILLCLLLPLGISEPLNAAEVPYDDLRYEFILLPLAEKKTEPEKSTEVIQAVMQEPVFNRYKTISQLKYTGDTAKQKKSDNYSDFIRSIAKFFEMIGQVLARLFEVGLWILLLILALLIIKYWSRLKIAFNGFKKTSTADKLPETLFGLDIREQSLPEDVRAEALKLIQSRQYRAALALLYRASLACLVRHHALELQPGATEGDCVQAMQQHLSSKQQIRYFMELTRAWQLTAYAHRTLPEPQLKKLVTDGAVFYEHLKPESDNSSDESGGHGYG